MHALHLVPPAVHVFQELRQRRARAPGQLVRVHQPPRRKTRRHAIGPREAEDLGHRGVANPTLWRVDDPLERQVVVLALHQPQIRNRIPDFRPLEEPRAAHHRVGQLQHDEAVFEAAHLERRANQDRHVFVLAAFAVGVLNGLGDDAALGLAVPHAGDAHLLAAVGLGPQRLAQPALVGRDQP